MVKKKRKHGGHYCKVCGCHKSNESFSGRGHALHICKECQSLPKDEQADMMRCNEVERAAFRFPMRRQDWELLEKYAKKYKDRESGKFAQEMLDMSQLKKLKDIYGAEPDNINDVIMLCPVDKLEERQEEYPSIEIHPIAFHSTDLNVQDWMFLLKAVGNESTYINQLRAIMRANRKNLNLNSLKQSVDVSPLLSASQKALAQQRLSFAEEYIDDSRKLGSLLRPGRLIIVDLRDEFIDKDDALGLFVIMLNIFAGVKEYQGTRFNKFIVFDEAHKYMDNKDLTSTIVTAIREMRHKGVSMMIASQDPMSLPTEIIELSSIMLMHKFNSPQWVKHVQKSITQLQTLSSSDMATLMPGEAYLWATKSTDKGVTSRPMKISTRPRVTKHGGDTIKAV